MIKSFRRAIQAIGHEDGRPYSLWKGEDWPVQSRNLAQCKAGEASCHLLLGRGEGTEQSEAKSHFDTALRVAQEGTKVDPTHWNSWIQSGKAQMALRRFAEAVVCFERAQAVEHPAGEDRNLAILLANCKECMGDTSVQHSDKKHALYEKACQFAAEGKHLEAVTVYERLLRISRLPTEKSLLYQRIASHYIALGQEEHAESPLVKAVELEDSAMALNTLGYVYFKQERYTEAISAYETALEFFQRRAMPHPQDLVGKFDESELRSNLQIARKKAAAAPMFAKLDRLDEMTAAFRAGDEAKLAELRKEPQENFVPTPDEFQASFTKMTQQCEELKQLGNDMFKINNFEAAVGYYTEGLSLCGGVTFNTIRATLLGNRCEAFLKTEQWHAARTDAEAALQLTELFDTKLHQKCQKRLSRARAGIKGGAATETKKREASGAVDELFNEAKEALIAENWKLADKRLTKVARKLKRDDPSRAQALYLNAEALHGHKIDGIIHTARANELNSESIEACKTALARLEDMTKLEGSSDPDLVKAMEVMDMPSTQHIMKVLGVPPVLSHRERAQQQPQWRELSFWLVQAMSLRCKIRFTMAVTDEDFAECLQAASLALAQCDQMDKAIRIAGTDMVGNVDEASIARSIETYQKTYQKARREATECLDLCLTFNKLSHGDQFSHDCFEPDSVALKARCRVEWETGGNAAALGLLDQVSKQRIRPPSPIIDELRQELETETHGWSAPSPRTPSIKVCCVCHKEKLKLLRCAGCEASTASTAPRLYCSKACQKLDWKSHKQMCLGG